MYMRSNHRNAAVALFQLHFHMNEPDGGTHFDPSMDRFWFLLLSLMIKIAADVLHTIER